MVLIKTFHVKKGLYLTGSILSLTMLIWVILFRLPSTYSAAPLTGKVVDAQSGEPLPDTVVIAIWELQKGFSIEGSIPAGFIHIAEVLTDSNGVYRIDGWGPRRRPRGTYLGQYAPRLIVFREGYDFFSRGNIRENIFSDNRRHSMHYSSWNEVTIRLKRFDGGIESYYDVLQRLYWSLDVVFDASFGAQPCDWKKIPLTVDLFDQYYEQLTAQSGRENVYHIPDIDYLAAADSCDTDEEINQGGQ